MRLVACLGLCVLLSGCSDLSGIFSADEDDTVQAAPAAQIAPGAAPQPDDGFCRGVAAHDSEGYGFDDATRARVLQQSYGQCRAQFAR